MDSANQEAESNAHPRNVLPASTMDDLLTASLQASLTANQQNLALTARIIQRLGVLKHCITQ